jgi:hypothetical protein
MRRPRPLVSGTMRIGMLGILLGATTAAAEPPRARLPPKRATPGDAVKPADAAKPAPKPDEATQPDAKDPEPADLWSALITPRPHGEAWVVPPNATKDGAPSWDGGFSLGRILTPPVHADAAPWPRGMVITPPDVNDPMAIEPGTNALRLGKRRVLALPRELSRGFQDGADRFWDLVLPRNM